MTAVGPDKSRTAQRSKNKHQENKNGHTKSVATHFTRARGNESGNSNVDDRGSNNQESVNIRRSGRKNAAQASSSGSGHGEEEDDARPEENNEASSEQGQRCREMKTGMQEKPAWEKRGPQLVMMMMKMMMMPPRLTR